MSQLRVVTDLFASETGALSKSGGESSLPYSFVCSFIHLTPAEMNTTLSIFLLNASSDALLVTALGGGCGGTCSAAQHTMWDTTEQG